MKSGILFCVAALVLLTGCLFNDPNMELDPKTVSLSVPANPHLEALLYNTKWYRTFDSTSDISLTSLVYAWAYGDSDRKHIDSFFVGIDTLWFLPQDVPKAAGAPADTGNDWDLQVCPDGNCQNGLKAGVHGYNAAIHFGDIQEDGDTLFQTEHHFQFFPAVDTTAYYFTAPANSIFGAYMYVQSRSTGKSDTVFAFGTWKLPWDSLYLPPIRPVAGYLPKKSDFIIVNGKVRYTH